MNIQYPTRNVQWWRGRKWKVQSTDYTDERRWLKRL